MRASRQFGFCIALGLPKIDSGIAVFKEAASAKKAKKAQMISGKKPWLRDYIE